MKQKSLLNGKWGRRRSRKQVCLKRGDEKCFSGPTFGVIGDFWQQRVTETKHFIG
jgi:hypothetical protein